MNKGFLLEKKKIITPRRQETAKDKQTVLKIRIILISPGDYSTETLWEEWEYADRWLRVSNRSRKRSNS